MRKTIINVIVFALVGGTLADAGVTINTIHFWLCMLGLGAIQFNQAF